MSSSPRSANPRSPSAASSPQTNPLRTNNEREQQSSSREYDSYNRGHSGASSGADVSSTERALKQAKKVQQVTQNFFRRAALTIIGSRVNLAPSYDSDSSNEPRSSKWFQLIMDESDELSDLASDWIHVDVNKDRPSSMILEIYLDTGDLTRNQSLVMVDERGKKWDVCDAMKTTAVPGGRGRRERSPQIILERWKISLDDSHFSASADTSDGMANVYKKLVITMRALFTYVRMMPAWKLARSIAQEPATLMSLRPMYRLLKEPHSSGTKDTLTASFYPSAEPTCLANTFVPVKSPAGSYQIEVAYRKNCDFRVADYEALVSSYYMGMDEPGEPSSLGDGEGDRQYVSGDSQIGSLPVNRKWAGDRQELNTAYGSMSTFHNVGYGTGTSPISALRAARDQQMASGDMSSPPLRMPPNHRTMQSSKSSLKSTESVTQRRPSVSFQPFKAGSLSPSPGQAGLLSQSPGTSLPRTSSISQGFAQARSRPSLSALPQAALRIPQSISSPESALASPGPGSPKAPPLTRYSSSFGHRRSRMSSGGGSGSRIDEDNSSGKGSGSSSKRGSGTLAEGEGGGSGSGSSGSMQTDDDNISSFLSMLEQKSNLKSFNRTDDASREASNRRTASALNRYRGMRESTAALSDSMSSSMMMRHSSGSSSQRLSGVPPTLVGASVSTSSSPGKPISPHTPHTPAIPSRLSEQATIRSESRNRGQSERHSPTSQSNDGSSDSTSRVLGSGAIPIPTSPSGFPHLRRSSSAHQRHRAGMADLEPFDMRPASLPLDDRPDLSLSELAQMQQHGRQGDSAVGAEPGSPVRQEDGRQRRSQDSSSSKAASVGGQTPATPITRGQSSISSRPRLSRGSGSGSTASSFGRGSGSRFSFGNRPGVVSAGDDDEPLLFTMSELGRRSLEDIQAGNGSSGSGSESTRKPGDRKGQREGGRQTSKDW